MKCYILFRKKIVNIVLQMRKTLLVDIKVIKVSFDDNKWKSSNITESVFIQCSLEIQFMYIQLILLQIDTNIMNC